MSYHLIIGDKLHSSWSLRGALALDLAGATYTEELIKLNQPDTRTVAARPGGAPLAGGGVRKIAPAGKPCCYG